MYEYSIWDYRKFDSCVNSLIVYIYIYTHTHEPNFLWSHIEYSCINNCIQVNPNVEEMKK